MKFRRHTRVESAYTWVVLVSLIALWLPMTAIARTFDRDPARYPSGRFFRRLGWWMSRANRAWRIEIDGEKLENPRNPYVVVCNHLAMADIPIICALPWEMKWIAKKELLKMPLIGWLMQLVGDIPLDRSSKISRARVLITARQYLKDKCSVMFFPEGTRSPDGRLYGFSDGAFRLAIKTQVPVLPLVIDGSQHTLPRPGWRFGRAHVRLRVLPPVETKGLNPEDTEALRDRVRSIIAGQLATWRGVSQTAVDALIESAHGTERPAVALTRASAL